MVVVPPLRLVDRMFTPGAQMSTQGPKLLQDASLLLLSVAATVTTPLLVPAPARAGEELQALAPSLPAATAKSTPLFASSRDSYTRPVSAAAVRDADPAREPAAAAPSGPGPRVLAVAAEGHLPGADRGTPPLRVVIVGDGDFASNSFLPYLANSDLALSMVRWLVREERTTSVASRIPVPAMILLSGAQMRTIFLAIEVLLPLAVFLPALVMWWRRR